MSKTFATNKARTKRKMLNILSHRTRDQLAQEFNKINALEVSGHRYGNQRKAEAKQKVVDRRIERRKNNRDIDLDSE